MQTNSELSPGQKNARLIAAPALIAGAGRLAESFDKLATWFLGGFGAALAFTLANVKEVSAFIPVSCFGKAVFWFILASTCCLLQRCLAAIVQAGALAAEDGRKIGERMVEKSQSFDLPEFIFQMTNGIPMPFRLLVSSMWGKMAKGDFASGARRFVQIAIVQVVLVFVEVALLLVALWGIISHIKT